MKSLSIEKQQHLYDSLKRISKDYRSAESILRKAAIKGIKRPVNP